MSKLRANIKSSEAKDRSDLFKLLCEKRGLDYKKTKSDLGVASIVSIQNIFDLCKQESLKFEVDFENKSCTVEFEEKEARAVANVDKIDPIFANQEEEEESDDDEDSEEDLDDDGSEELEFL